MAKVCKTLASYRELVKATGVTMDEAIAKEKVLGIVQIFGQVEDVRCSGMIQYPLKEILMTAFLAVLSNADTWTEIEDFGKAKETWLRTFLPLENGIPSHDTFRRVFGLIERRSLQEITVQYLEGIMGEIAKTVNNQMGTIGVDKEEEEYRPLNMDGKEERGSGRKDGTDEEITNVQTFHIYDNSSGICLKSEPIADKTNEIPVAQDILRTMNLNGCVITADALHTQKLTCKIIYEQRGHYVLGLKKNQPGLFEEAELCFDDDVLKKLKRTKNNKAPSYVETSEKAHNQIEKRRYFMVEAYHEPKTKDDIWTGLRSFIRFEKETENLITHKNHTEVRYYITSLSNLPLCAEMIRGHWGVENSLHWQLDYSFHFDENTTMNKDALTNLGIMKKMTLTLLKLFQPLIPGKKSLRVLRKMLGWEPETMIPTIFYSFSSEAICKALLPPAGHLGG